MLRDTELIRRGVFIGVDSGEEFWDAGVCHSSGIGRQGNHVHVISRLELLRQRAVWERRVHGASGATCERNPGFGVMASQFAENVWVVCELWVGGLWRMLSTSVCGWCPFLPN